MSTQIRKERKHYYDMLEATQKGSLDITGWLTWFLGCLSRAFMGTTDILSNVLLKARFWEKHASAGLNDRQKLNINRMLNGIEGKITSSKCAEMAKCSKETAIRDIQDLISKGMMVKEEAGGRSTSYVISDTRP